MKRIVLAPVLTLCGLLFSGCVTNDYDDYVEDRQDEYEDRMEDRRDYYKDQQERREEILEERRDRLEDLYD